MNRDQNKGFFKFIIEELKPKGKIVTPFNIIAAITIIAAVVIIFIRFMNDLGSVIDGSQERPWGLWVTFNVITGVAFAGGAYVITFMVYILGLEKYKPVVRASILYALLDYICYASALMLDLGRPWKIINPIIGNAFGVSSVLFLVAWKFLFYMGSLLVEFSPVVAEWSFMKKQRAFLASMTTAVVIFGITLSTLHQSGLGALFLMARPKIHPLWYSELTPLLFFISSIFAGLSLVIVLESAGQKVFGKIMSFLHKTSHRPILISLARVCSITMFVYFFFKILVLVHDRNLSYLATGWGTWYLVEILGFVLLPCLLFLAGYRKGNLNIIRAAAIFTIAGIILNRLNVSTIAFRWYDNVVHLPTLMEVVVSVAVIFVQLIIFRAIVRRMPVYTESPAWVKTEKANRTLVIKDDTYSLTNINDETWKISQK